MPDGHVTGRCLCGGVEYSVAEFIRPVVACHCNQCRKTSGHFVAATKARNSDLTMIKQDTLTWFRSSETAERGFCNCCGSNLFWRPVDGETTSIMAGALETPTGLQLAFHIFTGSAGDYYQINDGLPAYDEGGERL